MNTTRIPELKLVNSPKPKTVRFAQLVQASGKPEVVTLWADPKKDKSFMELVRKKRVATIVQKPTSVRKDFGYIGFHPRPFAAFMVFPKPLKPEDGLQIIGIKYNLLEMPKEDKPSAVKEKAPPKPEPKKPVEKSFTVGIVRTLTQELQFEVKSKNASEAKADALVSAKEVVVPSDTKIVSDKIVNVSETDQ